jgi:flagellar assembly protein FliH
MAQILKHFAERFGKAAASVESTPIKPSPTPSSLPDSSLPEPSLAEFRTDDAHRAAREVVGLAGFNLDDLADQGRKQIDLCRLKVTSMIEEAKQQADAIREQARREGYAAGTEAAKVDFEKKVRDAATANAESAVASMRGAVNQMQTAHQQWMDYYAETLSGLVVSACERILCIRLDKEPELILRWAQDALLSARSATQLTLAVHPETLAHLAEPLDEILGRSELPEHTHVVPDENVARNAVVVRQLGGEIHAGLEAQLQRLTELLT